ncbi:peptidoglycan-binding protein [Ferrovibrio xuzhouensis]|uniref:Peptidoglycan-binding protein n=1 Tax=Ferrovibrio xuzhouensis TaxID=1576914 RepID=A0ABV7VE76_9PROT
MAETYRMRTELGPDRPAEPDDVWSLKQTLNLNGYYPIPDYGLTPFPDQPLFDGIRRYQQDNSLNVDGIMKPGGETETHMLANLDVRAPTFRCINCGAWHGGAYGLLCPDCWKKLYG